jgi:ATP-binding cassette, subfamily B, bacterial
MRNPVAAMMKNTWKYAKGHRAMLILAVGLSVIANGLIVVEPFVFGLLLKDLQAAMDAGTLASREMFVQAVQYLLILAALPGLFWVFHGISRVFESIVAYNVMGNYCQMSLAALFALPVEWHRGNHSGKNIDKFNRAGLALKDFADEIFVLTEIIIGVLGSFAFLFFVEFYVGLLAAGISAFTFVIVVIFDKYLHAMYKRLHVFYNKTASVSYDYISNVFTVLTMRFEEAAVQEYLRRFFAPFKLYKKKVIVNECKWASVTFFITLMTVGVVAWEVLGAISAGEMIVIGTLYTLWAYLERIGHNFYQFAWKYSKIVEQDASVASANNIFEAYAKLGGKVDENELRVPELRNWDELEVRGLHFTYEDEQKVKHQIKDVNLTIKRGERIAFVGESGCGKSTVLGLLRGIYKAQKGELWLGANKLPHGLLHLAGMTTLMPQEPEIFENTIRYNVAMGVSVPLKKVKEVLKLARFDGVLKKLPKGMDTNIAEKGVNLSGGEKQRLALARGLLAAERSDIILMDEPTSSVDMENERAILEGVFQNSKDKTIIASVHRLSLLPMFDKVVYFEGGRVVQVEERD